MPFDVTTDDASVNGKYGDAWKAVIGIDLDTKPRLYHAIVEPVGESVELKVAPKAFRTRRLSVNEAFVTPPASAEARIAREAEMMAEAWRHSAPEHLWGSGFVRPVPHEANSAFGTRSIFNGQPRGAHSGADFLSPAGRPIKAPGGGRVVLAKDTYYAGGTVIIDHGLGIMTLYGHMSSIAVKEGQTVEKGAVLGRSGTTGLAAGDHLHFTVLVAGRPVNPVEWWDTKWMQDRVFRKISEAGGVR